MIETQHLTSDVDRGESKDRIFPPPPSQEAPQRIEWSHFGVLPPHKESRRNRYVRTRRRGLWKERS